VNSVALWRRLLTPNTTNGNRLIDTLISAITQRINAGWSNNNNLRITNPITNVVTNITGGVQTNVTVSIAGNLIFNSTSTGARVTLGSSNFPSTDLYNTHMLNVKKYVENNYANGTCFFFIGDPSDGIASNIRGVGNRNGYLEYTDIIDIQGNIITNNTYIEHEFGHLLGLEDRYWYIQRTACTNSSNIKDRLQIIPLLSNPNIEIQTNTQLGTLGFEEYYLRPALFRNWFVQVPIWLPLTHDPNYFTDNNMYSSGNSFTLTPMQWSIVLNQNIIEELPLDYRIRTIFATNGSVYSSTNRGAVNEDWPVTLPIYIDTVPAGEFWGNQKRVLCRERTNSNGDTFINTPRTITTTITTPEGTSNRTYTLLNPYERAKDFFIAWGHPRYPKRCSKKIEGEARPIDWEEIAYYKLGANNIKYNQQLIQIY
jgi:hypothetical protein